jgi:hypothetical protein
MEYTDLGMQFIHTGQYTINLDTVAYAQDGDKGISVYFIGGGTGLRLQDEDAKYFRQAIGRTPTPSAYEQLGKDTTI